MFKKLLFLIALLIAAVIGAQIYAKQAPTSRVALVVNRVQQNLPRLLGGHANLQDVGQDVIDQIKKDEAKQGGKVTVYKWRDANGDWTYGNSPPPGVKAVPQDVDLSKTNRLSQ